jgi:serine/threonine protein kinase
MSTDRASWQRVRALFDELVELEPAPREARLEDVARADPVLHEQVQRLLRADGRAEIVLHDYSFGSPAADLPQATSRDSDPLRVIGTTVSHFLVTKFLAAGGMGVVYTADDLLLGRTVALKFPLPHQQLKRTAKERFINEAKSAAMLDHPNLCTVHEIGECEHGLFLAMPLYAGETLKDRLLREGCLPTTTALGIAQQVVRGLAAAHDAGIIHRDLKPGNIMLLPDGTVKILDFGLAKIRDADLTRSQMTLGTIGYVAPEQLRGGAAEAQSDLWALGVMLYEMLTGSPPFRGDHELSVLDAVLHHEPSPPSAGAAGIAPELDQLTAALLQKDPGDRYGSAAALLVDLEALQRGEPLTQKPNPRRRRWRRSYVIAAAAAAALGIGGASWALLVRSDGSPGDATSGLQWVNGVAEVRTAEQLVAALDPAHAGRRVRLAPGEYDITRTLTIPDGMSLEGAGVMRFDADGLPMGFAEGTTTAIRITESVGGDVLTLGEGASLRNLEVADLLGRSGNVVAVVTRRPGDRVTATISNAIIVNPNPLTIGATGPLGRALFVSTVNPNLGSDPPPHSGSVVAVRLVRSMIRSPSGGGGLFVYNFAAQSTITVDVIGNVIGGSNEANGGVSRPDAVHDSEVRVRSERNLYRNEWEDPCLSPLRGWNLTGGSSAPIPIAVPATVRNRLILQSVDDRIEGFTMAVLATGSRRFFQEPLNAAPADNSIDLHLTGTSIASPSCARAAAGVSSTEAAESSDLRLFGAWAENATMHAGDRNTLRAEFRNVTGSGARANSYAHVSAAGGEMPMAFQGTGNRLELVGDAGTFARLNRQIAPAPAAEFFTAAGVPDRVPGQ